MIKIRICKIKQKHQAIFEIRIFIYFFHKNSKFNNVFKHVTFTYMHLYKDTCNVSDLILES